MSLHVGESASPDDASPRGLPFNQTCSTLKPGRDIGAYRIVRLLGRGGMATVYEVEHRALGTRLALKMFTLDHGDADFLRARFLAEGRILARLRNPRLVRVYDLGVDEATGSPYFTMDLVLGPDGTPATLEQVRRRGGVKGEDVARWYEDLQEGLNIVHAAGIVHRDVKLENVLLDGTGHAVLSDFGVSRILSEALGAQLNVTDTMSLKTPEGSRVFGTDGYLAPEIRAGGAATAASDFYALGFLLFRLLTGVWYEPGTEVFELLAPFDVRWREVLGALLDPDPTKRRMLPMAHNGGKGLFSARRRWLPWIGAAAMFALCTAVSLAGLVGLDIPHGMDGEVAVNAPLALPLSGDVALDFVACPAGTFQMGLKGDNAADSIRREHSVRLTHPFWFGKYPVTVAQWEAVMGDAVEMTPEMAVIGKAKLPMNAMKVQFLKFCDRLTERFADRLPAGYVFRPPTEAEWEYACRGCGTDPEDVYNRFFRDDYCTWLYDENSQITSLATNLYIYTDESLAAILRERGIENIPPFTSWSGTRVFAPIGEHQPNSCGIHDLNIGGTGEISLDSIDPARRGTDGYGYGPGQTALAYDDEETDPVRRGSTNEEAFIQLVFARGTHKMPMLSGASCRNTLRVVVGYDILNAKPVCGIRVHFR